MSIILLWRVSYQSPGNDVAQAIGQKLLRHFAFMNYLPFWPARMSGLFFGSQNVNPSVRCRKSIWRPFIQAHCLTGS